MENNTFKSALFGGFRRDDVIAYIEKSATESGNRITALEAHVKKLKGEVETLRGDLESVSGERDRLTEQGIRVELDDLAGNRGVHPFHHATRCVHDLLDKFLHHDSVTSKSCALQSQSPLWLSPLISSLFTRK